MAYRKLGHKPLSAESKQIIINVYEKIREKNPKIFVEGAAHLTAEFTGSSAKTVFRIKKELKTTNKLTTPPRTRKEGRPMGNRVRRLNKYDDVTLRAIRAKINELYSETGKPPTMNRLMVCINADDSLPNFNNERTLGLLVHDMGYKFGKNKVTSAKTATRLLKIAQSATAAAAASGQQQVPPAPSSCSDNLPPPPLGATNTGVSPPVSGDIDELRPVAVESVAVSASDTDNIDHTFHQQLERESEGAGSSVASGTGMLVASELLVLSDMRSAGLAPMYSYENPPSFSAIGPELQEGVDQEGDPARHPNGRDGHVETDQRLFQCL